MEQGPLRFTFEEKPDSVEQELSDLEDFLWGDATEALEATEGSEGELGRSSGEPQTLNEELPVLLEARKLQTEFLTGIFAALPQAFSFLAACGPACIAHGHGLLSAASSAGSGLSSGVGLPGFHHGHDHAHDNHGHDHSHTPPSFFSAPKEKALVPSSHSQPQSSRTEFLWLPALWSRGMQTVAVDEIWSPSGNRTSVSELATSFLAA